MSMKFFLSFILGIFLITETFSESDKRSPENDNIQTSSNAADVKKYAPYLLVSCMDFRLRGEVQKFMKQYVGEKSYDEFVIPGASIGVLNDKYSHWSKTFEDVVKLAIKLHNITHVIFLDHRDCGAYKMLSDNYNDSRDQETAAHSQQFRIIREMMKEKFPQIHIETLIMGLNGDVEMIEN